ncbi:MAG: hypothetical protein OXG24_02215 [Gammaproteobacteria bacterium]|nr:hypothetical protein [Gammaproteobacteria bacterium]
MSISSIQTSAPGKVVVSGEYAVLIGAPAITMAVNRRAKCLVEVSDSGDWSIKSQPSFWDANFTLDQLAHSSTSDLIASVLNRINMKVNVTPHARLNMDTRPLFQFGKKMGLGSSAATLVSLYVAVHALYGEEYSIEEALRLHDEVYTSGSGIDIATCFSGGVIRFQERQVDSISLPTGIWTKVFFVGASTTTSDKVLLFNDWLNTQPQSTTDRIKDASSAVAESVDRADEFLEALRYFIEIQEFIDNGSRIGIWGPQHRAMKSLANRDGVLYKPSGAGGGDIGLALSTDLEALDHLSIGAERLGLKEIDALVEKTGVRIESVH